jgi:diguanylate cyclase (GGDEF)-like protein/putative nucleotidyltransferase with HDIG domain
LPNRRKLVEDLETAFSAPALDKVGLALFDLNGFKTYNDLFGHPAGDTMLTRLAQRLSRAVDGEATAYRIGGDEFCVVTRSRSPEEVFERALAALSAQGEWFAIEAAYGQVLIPAEATELSSALQIADGRLYAHKRATRSSAIQQTRDVLMQVMIEQDPGLRTHASHVAELAEATAQRLGLSADEVWYVRLAAELHDIGKAAMPESLLDKPGSLDEAEWSFMKRHSVIGERIVSAAPALARVAGIVRAIHERIDGTGYPDGLAENEVPLGSKIVAVADAFDAMTSARPYAPSRSVDEAFAELERHAGTQFDADVVEAFILVVESQSQTEPSGAENASDRAATRLKPQDFRQQRLCIRLARALARARARHWEKPLRSEMIARRVGERALVLGDSALYGRSLTLQAQIAMRQGRVDDAFELLEEAQGETKRSGDAELRAELAVAYSRLYFLAGLYRDALAQAEEAVALADRHQLVEYRMAARRGLSLVLGSVEQSERLRVNAIELLELTVEFGDRREEAMARNDLAHCYLQAGELQEAATELERTIALCGELRAAGRFPLAYAYSTRAELRVAAGDSAGAVGDCDAALELANAIEAPERHLTAMTAHTKLNALIGQGELDLAVSIARTELDRLGDDVPHARSLILRASARALRELGRTDEAFAALHASAELDRVTFEQLTARQLDLQRAALEAQAARNEAQVLSTKNAQLEELVSELRRTRSHEAA